MKKMNHSFLRKINIVLLALLGIIGFSSCEREPLEEDGPRLMYGTPRSEFVVKEKVAYEENGENIVLKPETDE